MKSILGACVMFLLVWFSYQEATPSQEPTSSIQVVRIGPSETAKLALVDPAEVFLINMIPYNQSEEFGQESEPFLAVHPAEQLMVGAVYYGESTTGDKPPPLFLSNDGGKVWSLVSIIPAKKVWSQSYCFSDTGKSFYGAIQTEISGGQLRDVTVLHTDDPTNNRPLKDISVLRGSVTDQPFIQVRSFSPAVQTTSESSEARKRVDRIYVGQNYFGRELPEGQTASLRVSIDGGETFRLFGLEARSTEGAGQDGPSVRPAIAGDGTVYVAFFHWTSKRGPNYSGDLVIVRDDGGATGENSFQSLIEPTDEKPGRKVVSNRLFPYGQYLGKQLIGSPLSLAVDPAQSSNLYVAWVDFDPPLKSNVLHVKRSTDRGQTWSNDLLGVPSAVNPALAVSQGGEVGLLFQQLSGPKGDQRWETHFRKSPYGVGAWTDVTLTTFPTAIEPARQYDPYLGYRVHLLSVNNNFYGIFSAPNIPDPKYFPQGVEYQRKHQDKELLSKDGEKVISSIDPYFFRIPATRVSDTTPLNVAPNAMAPPATWLGFLSSKWFILGWVLIPAAILGLVFLFQRYQTPHIVDRAVTKQVDRAVTEQVDRAVTEQVDRAVTEQVDRVVTEQVDRVVTKQVDRAVTEQVDRALHERVKPPPTLTNYEGFITARFTDAAGNAVVEIGEGLSCNLIVEFHQQNWEALWKKRISVQGGQDLPDVVFTVVIDTDDFEIARDHKTVSVPVNETREVVFPLVATGRVREHSIFVQVFQSTQLVQVLAPTLTVLIRDKLWDI